MGEKICALNLMTELQNETYYKLHTKKQEEYNETSTKDNAKGKMHQAKGKVKEVVGKVVGNRDL